MERFGDGGGTTRRAAVGGLLLALGLPGTAARAMERARLEPVVNAAIEPVLAAHDVPGMAVGVTAGGRRHVFTYGLASCESGKRVTEATLFEIGSVSKAYTATLVSYAAATGKLRLSDPASRHAPELAGSAFDRISVLDLGTYTAGGLPLQFPKEVADERGMAAYFRGWRPAHAPGTHRLYSNPSLGLFGHLAARSLGEPFDAVMERAIIRGLGLRDTFIRVPPARMADYAFGYNREGRPVRVNPGVLASEAYGVKTTAGDLLAFVEANMGAGAPDEALRRAIEGTHVPYHRIGPMMQGLGWEMYPYPTDLDALVAGNSPDIVMKANAVTRLDPGQPPAGAMLLNKTGATNGFGAYAAFVPARDIGVVLLANRNYPNPARIRAAHAILTALDGAREGTRTDARSPPRRAAPRGPRSRRRGGGRAGPARRRRAGAPVVGGEMRALPPGLDRPPGPARARGPGPRLRRPPRGLPRLGLLGAPRRLPPLAHRARGRQRPGDRGDECRDAQHLPPLRLPGVTMLTLSSFAPRV